MIARNALVAAALVGAAHAGSALAATVPLPSNNVWLPFSIDSLLAPASPSSLNLGWIDDSGDPLRFTFVIANGFIGTLSVLDLGLAGDTFSVFSSGAPFVGSTSLVPVRVYDPLAVALGLQDTALALADPNYSRGTFTLSAGSYNIGGLLQQSVIFDNARLDATLGAVRLSVAAVPEPSSYALFLAGVGVMAMLARRRDPNRTR